jgi:hypothetical protein
VFPSLNASTLRNENAVLSRFSEIRIHEATYLFILPIVADYKSPLITLPKEKNLNEQSDPLI